MKIKCYTMDFKGYQIEETIEGEFVVTLSLSNSEFIRKGPFKSVQAAQNYINAEERE
jgi:hypothetical protein